MIDGKVIAVPFPMLYGEGRGELEGFHFRPRKETW